MSNNDIQKNLFNILKNTFCEFLSIDKKGKLNRNILGAILVLLPEMPAYFIPAYSEAKATGDAKNIKKGEGLRGLLTGALEGLAVGAIVSTVDKAAESGIKDAAKKLNFKRIFPFVVVAAAVQFVSSKVFPVIGEKIGRAVYLKNNPVSNSSQPPVQKPAELATGTPAATNQLKGASLYPAVKSGSLKI